MSIAALLRSVPSIAFGALSGIPEDVTYRYNLGATSYDVEEGKVTIDSTTFAVRAVFVAYSLRELENEAVQPGDMKAH